MRWKNWTQRLPALPRRAPGGQGCWGRSPWLKSLTWNKTTATILKKMTDFPTCSERCVISINLTVLHYIYAFENRFFVFRHAVKLQPKSVPIFAKKNHKKTTIFLNNDNAVLLQQWCAMVYNAMTQRKSLIYGNLLRKMVMQIAHENRRINKTAMLSNVHLLFLSGMQLLLIFMFFKSHVHHHLGMEVSIN